MNISISAVIITKDSVGTIEKCLNSVKWLDDIVVVDSGSKDDTIKIAGKFTDRIFTKEWIGYSEQKNFAVSKAKNNWVLNIDSDEWLSEELIKEIIDEWEQNNDVDGYLIPFRHNYFGRWLKYGGFYPDYHLRLVKKKYANFIKVKVHEGISITGSKKYLKNPIMHEAYTSIKQYFDKFNRYTFYEAQDRFINGEKVYGYSLFIKPVHRFIKSYVIKFGFFDSMQGFLACIFSSFYIFVVYLKLLELYNGFDKKTNLLKSILKR